MDGIYWIYCIENKVNGKKYIGKATNPKRRWASHISVSKKESKYQKYLHRAISKYGIDNFWFRCIHYSFTEIECLEYEKYWIKFFKTQDPKFGYNLTAGGEGESGYKHTPTTKELLSKLAKEKVGELNPFFGKTHTTKTKELISSSRQKVSSKQIEYMIDSYKNKKISVKVLAQELGISTAHAYELINGKYKRK